MSERKIRLGRFDKWGYKNSFSKGELARELVYTNEDNDNLKQALNEIREYCNNNINENNDLIERLEGTSSFRIGNAKSKIKDYEDILQIIDKALGDEA